MKRVGNLYEAIAEWENLLHAFYLATRGKRLKNQAMQYEKNLYHNLKSLQDSLLFQNVSLGEYRFFTIYDPKERLICAAPFEDRVLHHAIMNVAEPMFEKMQIYDSYACRKNKGTESALIRALHFTKHFGYFLKLDIRKYFDSIPHTKLKQILAKLCKDKALLSLFNRIVDSYSVREGYGLPIGNLTSQYFANMYLAVFDRYVKENLKIKGYIRYMDDMLIFLDSMQKIKDARVHAVNFLSEKLYLTCKEQSLGKTEKGVPFLGFLIKPRGIFLLQKKKKRFKKRFKEYQYKFESGVWTEEEYAMHITSMFAHLKVSRCRAWCNRLIVRYK